jgi:hypothetical protein
MLKREKHISWLAIQEATYVGTYLLSTLSRFWYGEDFEFYIYGKSILDAASRLGKWRDSLRDLNVTPLMIAASKQDIIGRVGKRGKCLRNGNSESKVIVVHGARHAWICQVASRYMASEGSSHGLRASIVENETWETLCNIKTDGHIIPKEPSLRSS